MNTTILRCILVMKMRCEDEAEADDNIFQRYKQTLPTKFVRAEGRGLEAEDVGRKK